MRILEDPDTTYSATSNGTMKFVEFMNRVGTVKNKPASWQGLYFPAVHHLPGS